MQPIANTEGHAPTTATWRPISTAPRDGRPVLVYPPTFPHSGKTCAVACYCDDRYSAHPRPYWARDDALGHITLSRTAPPTHWAELPAAPDAAATMLQTREGAAP
ncbi:MAG TPA: hypothetical protein VF292_03015 [Rhodanobacteraceae bacterium]